MAKVFLNVTLRYCIKYCITNNLLTIFVIQSNSENNQVVYREFISCFVNIL